ncbi:hypothetical protein CC80DRAFT_505850 [Byssothecium circinans]|uniref:Uncharacterized protein n=1 Tax=Byssothecium circinans TaxID=147558 RepID=A0A6A5TTF0_9PLEO|nr:hypothetical protein CC80DRAFT_505850 [Byssothecium circinans]
MPHSASEPLARQRKRIAVSAWWTRPHRFVENNGVVVNVDTGFIAMNEETYHMSFGVSVDERLFEWGSGSLQAYLGSWSNLVRPWFWRLCFDVLRFNLTSANALWTTPMQNAGPADSTPQLQDETCHRVQLESIGHYLERLNYSRQFAELYLIPMVAAPWCIDPMEFSRNFPAKFLIGFMCGIPIPKLT